MKKVILLATAALAFGGVAYAQDNSMAPAQTGTATPDASATPAGTQDMSQPPAAGQAPDATGGTTQAPDASGGMTQTPPAGGDMSGQTGTMPGGQQPGMSGTSTPPGTATGPNGPVSMTPTQGPTDLPMCSRTVTDNCKQGGSGAAHHRATRHRKH